MDRKQIYVIIVITFLVLQFFGSTVSDIIGKVAENVADQLSSRIQIEQMISGGLYHGNS